MNSTRPNFDKHSVAVLCLLAFTFVCMTGCCSVRTGGGGIGCAELPATLPTPPKVDAKVVEPEDEPAEIATPVLVDEPLEIAHSPECCEEEIEEYHAVEVGQVSVPDTPSPRFTRFHPVPTNDVFRPRMFPAMSYLPPPRPRVKPVVPLSFPPNQPN